MTKIFSQDDLQKCCELYVKVFNGSPWYDKWTNDTAHAYLRELADNNRFLGYTLWDNDVLIGAVFAHMKNHYKGEEIFIDELFISPECQRKGYGMVLMDAVEKYARENGFVSVTLLTGVNKPPFAFYEKLGYKHLSHLAFMHKRMI